MLGREGPAASAIARARAASAVIDRRARRIHASRPELPRCEEALRATPRLSPPPARAGGRGPVPLRAVRPARPAERGRAVGLRRLLPRRTGLGVRGLAL